MTDAPAGSAGRPILLLMGAVGAGKGTQAGVLSAELGLVHLASGNLFRRAIAEGSPLGEEARQYMDRGELVPDETTIAMFMDELAKPEARDGAILDGFPRTVSQAQALDETLDARGERILRVLSLEVPTEVLVRRVAGRWICPVCGTPYHVDSKPPRVAGRCDLDDAELVQRPDDTEEVVRARLASQVPPMLAVVGHYQAAGIVERIDGRRPVDEVSAELLALLRPLVGST